MMGRTALKMKENLAELLTIYVWSISNSKIFVTEQTKINFPRLIAND